MRFYHTRERMLLFFPSSDPLHPLPTGVGLTLPRSRGTWRLNQVNRQRPTPLSLLLPRSSPFFPFRLWRVEELKRNSTRQGSGGGLRGRTKVVPVTESLLVCRRWDCRNNDPLDPVRGRERIGVEGVGMSPNLVRGFGPSRRRTSELIFMLYKVLLNNMWYLYMKNS